MKFDNQGEKDILQESHPKNNRRQEDISELVYESLFGHLLPEYTIPWVENIFLPGKPCYEAYCRMHRAYERLRERLGVIDEDEDVEVIIDSLLDYSQISGLEMFKYGIKYQQMQNSETDAD